MTGIMANCKAFERPAHSVRPGRRRRSIIAGVVTLLRLLMAVLVVAGGCVGNGGSGGLDTGGEGRGHGDGDALFPRLPKVVGHIDLVEARPDNPRYFRRLDITDDAGRRWSFRADGWAGVSAAHLKDHRIQGATVTVWYEKQRDGSLSARFVSD